MYSHLQQTNSGNQCCGSGFIESDPDPAFHVNPDTNPDPDTGLGEQNLKERNTAEKNYPFC